MATPVRRSPTRLTVSTVQSLAQRWAEVASSNQSARADRATTGTDRASADGGRRRRRPGSTGPPRPAAECPLRSAPGRCPTTCRERATRAPAPPRSPRERPGTTRCVRRRPGRSGPHRPSARGGLAPDRPSSPRYRSGCAHRQSPRRSSTAALSSLPTRRFTSAASAGSTGPAVGTPRWASPGRHRDPGSWSTTQSRRSRALDPSCCDEPDFGPRLEQRRRVAIDSPHPSRRVAEKVPPTRRGPGVDSRVHVGDRDRSSRFPRPGRRPARQPQRLVEATEVCTTQERTRRSRLETTNLCDGRRPRRSPARSPVRRRRDPRRHRSPGSRRRPDHLRHSHFRHAQAGRPGPDDRPTRR